MKSEKGDRKDATANQCREGTRGPFHAPPQLKPRYEVKSGKEGVRVLGRDAEALCECGATKEHDGGHKTV